MSKKNNYKKHLIRNTELSVPETEVTKSAPPPTPIEEVEKKSNKTVPGRFTTPEPYSTLKLSTKIDNVVQTRKCKSTSDLDKKKLALDEKVARQVNFPFDQAIYKDLVPLRCNKNNENQLQSTSSNRTLVHQKDKEPNLMDFVTQEKIVEEHHFLGKSGFNFKENKSAPLQQSNLSLYKALQLHKDNVFLS